MGVGKAMKEPDVGATFGWDVDGMGISEEWALDGRWEEEVIVCIGTAPKVVLPGEMGSISCEETVERTASMSPWLGKPKVTGAFMLSKCS